ncbi:hypothetical protein [Pseudomonas syringae]|uniref:hypothetical protein n=1 Tax=Pseudomonas syringae TaxID=317 RepID=UPI000E329876|nr:hypothetical protein [Pseudomonas syringae]
MPTNYLDFLESAKQLVEAEGASEISYRNSTSRAYYGFYHIALQYADTVNLPPISDWTGGTHEKLSAFFEGNFNADSELRLKLRGIGYALKQNHRARCKADYKLHLEVTEESAKAQLLSCTQKSQVVSALAEALAA